MAIDPTTLTAANLATQKAALAKRRGAFDTAWTARSRLLAYLADQRKRKPDKALESRIRAQLARTDRTAQVAKKNWQLYDKNTYKPFEQTYNQFDKLDKGSPDLDGVLNKVLPFDPQSAADRLGAQQNLNQTLLRVKQGKDQLQTDYSQGVQDLSKDQPDRYRQLLSSFAGRGMARSSGYADAYGRETADFTRAQSDLDTARGRGMATADLDSAGAQSFFQSQLAAILSNSTSRLAANAGGLGMAGNKDLPLLLELARRRLAGTGS